MELWLQGDGAYRRRTTMSATDVRPDKTSIGLKELPDWIYKCTGCTGCQGLYRTQWPEETWDRVCPMMDQRAFETATPGGLLWLVRGNLEGIVPMDTKTLEQLYSCTACKSCELQCYGDHGEIITDIFIAARERQIEEGDVFPNVRDFLENVHNYGNPWGQSRSKRGEWASEIQGATTYTPAHEFLYYVGSVGSYNPAGQRMAQSLCEVLVKAGVSFGILGAQEECDGNEVRLLGERGLFEMLSEKNVAKFKELGVRKVLSLSPHSYNAFKNHYPEFGEVLHYTKLLAELIIDRKLELSTFKAKVTYQDPCFLGRYNDIYDEPREILRAIPGVELVEIKRNRENAFCCGGGSGNFYLGLTDGRARVREAYATGADILAVACPICSTMLEDALKDEELEGKMSVMGISEIVKKAL
jgi:Fe-S oxidoreductase